jgi:hypothetical protein
MHTQDAQTRNICTHIHTHIHMYTQVISSLIALGFIVFPDMFKQETLVYVKNMAGEMNSAMSWPPEANASGGKAARHEWIIWKATAYKASFGLFLSRGVCVCVCVCVSCET